MQKTFVRTTVIDRCKQRLLFIIIFSQQETIGRCEEITLEDAFLFTEGIHPRHLHTQRPYHTGLAVYRFLQVGHQLCEAVATVEVLGVPLPAFVKGRCLAQRSFCRSHLGHRHLLWLQRSSTIHLIHVGQHDLQRGTIADDMVNVEEEVVVGCILQQTDME